MRRRDAVGALHLLRRIETMAARQSLAAAQDRARDAQAAHRQLLATFDLEAQSAPAATFAAWLPLARAQLAVAAADCALADAVVQRELAAVAAARSAERGVAEEVAQRAQIERAARLVEAQKLLDDVAQVLRDVGV